MSDHLPAKPGAMDLLPNPFRQALSHGRSLIGIWSMLDSENAIEGLGWSGYDWLLIDGEHAPISLQHALRHMRTLAGTPTIPIVRLAWNDKVLLKQYLDAGANVIMLPFVQSVAEAADGVAAMRYPPHGHRGVAAMHRASRYGRIHNYLKDAGDSLFLIVQVETLEALENVDKIAAVDGVDAIFFGPGDLAASMGMVGQADDPAVTEKIESAVDSVRKAGKAVGVLAPTAAIAERHIVNGLDFVSVANDAALLFSAADSAAGRFRAMAEAVKTRAAE